MKKISIVIIHLVLLFLLLDQLNCQSFTWTKQISAGSRLWKGITCSSNGTKLAAVVYGGYIYTSTNSGYSWTEQTSSEIRNWIAIAGSKDGTKLVACDEKGYIYTSFDSGNNWTEQISSGSRVWSAVTSSYDGTQLAATVNMGYIYTSTNSGVSWKEQISAGNRNWKSISCSNDGMKLVADVYSGYIYTSTDFGLNWIEQSSQGNRNWLSVASNYDGTKLVNIDFGGFTYTSNNSGSSWSQNYHYGVPRNWNCISLSSDSKVISACVKDGYIYISTDFGLNWTEQTTAGSNNWRSICSSNDGTKLSAVIDDGDIFTGVTSNIIQITSLLRTAFCPGTKFTVPFSIVGTFVSSNKFTVQISNSTGSFSNPVNIGNLISTTPDTINCIIPANIPIGSGYRIRIISSNPSDTGADNGKDIIIVPNPKSFVVGGGGLICAGGNGLPITLSGSETGVTYQMQLNGTLKGSPMNGTGNPLIFPNQDIAGIYTVVATNLLTGTNEIMSGSTKIGIINVPTQWSLFVANEGNLCNGDSGLAININGSDTGIVYQLYLNNHNNKIGNPIKGTGFTFYFPKQTISGSYFVEAVDTLTNCSTYQGSVSIINNDLPIKYHLSGGGVYCKGDSGFSLILNGSQAGVQYQLKLDDKDIGINLNGTGSAISFTNLKQAGTFTVFATNIATTCSSYMAESQTIVLLTKPPKPSISRTGNSLYSNASKGNQWFLNNQIINGATEASYAPNQNGNYSVQVTLVGCSSLISNLYSFVINSVSSSEIIPKQKTIQQIEPNPASNSVKVVLDLTQDDFIDLNIYNLFGEKVTNCYKGLLDAGAHTFDVDLSNLVSGSYYINLISSTSSCSKIIQVVK